MQSPSDKTREALMNAAEELFALRGIDSVSHRQITEHAGTANHSAINYHFGGRTEFLRALATRHLEPVRLRRQELSRDFDAETPLSDIVASRILPWVENLDSLPKPSWRARFLFQLSSMPVGSDDIDIINFGLNAQLHHKNLESIPIAVLEGRSRILGNMVLGVSARFERELELNPAVGTWQAVGYFLVDAVVGMVSAPVTPPDQFITPSVADSL